MTPRHASCLVALISLSGCAAETPFVRQPTYSAITEADVHATLAELLETRGWKLEGGPKVVLHSRKELEAVFAEKRSKPAPFPAGEEALAALFELLPPPAPDKPRVTTDKAKVEGFYRVPEDTLYVVNEKPTNSDMDVSQRAVLAHELHHALQFRRVRQPAKPNDDEVLAFQALIEGDAQTAELAYAAKLRRIPASRLLRRARYLIEEPKKVDPSASPAARSAWEAAPGAAHALQAFPYVRGLAFIVDLYRAGGFALVDQAYAYPPTTTEHILHPAKYLANELPRPIGTLTPPEGLTLLAQTTLGELRTRIFLEPCLGAPAADIAAGWHGDRAFALHDDRELVLGWVSAWDSEDDARALESGLAKMGNCFRENTAADKHVGTATAVRREGSVVAFTRGGDEATRRALLERLLPLPRDAPPANPLATIAIPPLRPPPEPSGGEMRGAVYRNDFLGLSVGVPEGAKATLFRPKGRQIDLLKVRGNGMFGAIGFSQRTTTPEDLEASFYEEETKLIEMWAKKGQMTARYGGQGEVMTPLGKGYQRSWSNAKGKPNVWRVTFIPVCRGTGSLMIQTNFSTKVGLANADAWIASFDWVAKKKLPPLCEYLDPEVTH